MVGECTSLPLSFCEKKQMPYCSWFRLLRHFRDRSATPSVDFTSARRTWLYPFTTSLKNGFAVLLLLPWSLLLCVYVLCHLVPLACWYGPFRSFSHLAKISVDFQDGLCNNNLIHAKPYQEGKIRWGVGYGVLLRYSCTSRITPGLVNIQYVDIPSDVFACDLGAAWLDQCGLTFVSDGSPESLRQEWKTH